MKEIWKMKHSNSSLPAENPARGKSEPKDKSEAKDKLKNEKKISQENLSLGHHFNQVKQENYIDTFPAAQDWLYKANIQLSNQTKLNERKLHKMKNFFFANKLRLVYTVIALALVAAACNMPVTHTENAGHIITWSMPASDKDAISKINALEWMKTAQVTAEETAVDGKTLVLYKAVLPNPTPDKVRAYASEIETIANPSEIRIARMDYDVKQPLYSAALDNFFSIKVDATGMSDEEVEREIQRQLKEQGVDMKFHYKTGADGKKDVFIERGPNDKEPHQFELLIDENNGKENIKMFQKKADPDKFKGKTDQEIKKMVMQDHPDVSEDEIKITREGNQVQVKVEVER
jgi:hypothetical protein